MLTRALALSLLWLVVAMAAVLVRGTAVRRRSPVLSVLWLLVVIGSGDWAALFMFGRPSEVMAASLVAFVMGIAWIILLPNWNALGHAAWSASVISTVLFLTHSFAVAAFTPQNVVAFLLSFALALVEVFALLLSLTFLYETLDVCTRVRWNRVVRPQPPMPGYAPKVSLHVPSYNEPALTVEQTLRALGKLDYPNFEVLLVDNNTPDPKMWQPLEAVCRELGPNFKMLHLDDWPGYKSGALNFALTQTALDAEIIGVIDADYLVEPSYLRELVPLMCDPRVAFVHTPQDYRAYERDPYLEACYDGYKYFFEVPMPSRNEHNAIIFGGTMGLIRKSVLQEIGGWDECCITEDAEASLRILKLRVDLCESNIRTRDHAPQLRWAEAAALSLVLWGDPNPPQALGSADAMGSLGGPCKPAHRVAALLLPGFVTPMVQRAHYHGLYPPSVNRRGVAAPGMGNGPAASSGFSPSNDGRTAARFSASCPSSFTSA